MKEYIIDQNSDGQRLDRFLTKLMPLAGKNFLQKMLRKKRIKLNGNRANPKDTILLGDTIQIYFSDETISDFSRELSDCKIPLVYRHLFEKPIFENTDILVVNKPVGLLSQPDSSEALSLVDMAVSYLNETQKSENLTFRPSVSNRLDRNTSGVVMIPKNYTTLKQVNEAIRERKTTKEYRTIVKGEVKEGGELRGHLIKDFYTNTVSLLDDAAEESKEVHLRYTPLISTASYTLLNIELFTGRTHQIRSQLSDAGYPIIGDAKYGNPTLNRQLANDYGLSHHLLHSFQYVVPSLSYTFNAPYPTLFKNLLTALGFNKGF